MAGGELRDAPTLDSPAPVAEPEALTSYRARMSRLRIRYAAAIAAVLVLGIVGFWVLWLTGEAHDATLRTATSPEPAVADEPLASTLAMAWSSDDATATGSFLSRGTVVTYSDHAVRGRDALTGDVRWSYTRSDVTVCGVDTQDGVAVAIFRRDGNCDEVIGLSLSSGDRLWNRTLVDDGESTMQSRPASVAITASTSVHVISPAAESTEPSGGLDRWFYQPAGCTIDSSKLGSAGVLVATRCASAGDPDRSAQQPKLVLRKPNDDADVWAVDGEAAIPVLAESALVLGWDDRTGQLIAFDPANGARIAALALPDCPAGTTPIASSDASGAGSEASVQCDQTLSRVSLQGRTLSIRWSTPASGLPAPQTATEQAGATAVIPVSTGFTTIDLATGTRAGSSASAPAEATGALAQAQRIERFGAGVLIAGPTTLMLQPPG